MKRWGVAPALFALAGCGGAAEQPTPAGEPIACALDGAAGFAEVCTVERDGSRLVVRRPDGGFRRFAPNGSEIEALDGADPVAVARLSDGSIELSIADDRYRLKLAAPSDAPGT